jgi:hypothetical protein
MHPDDRKKYEAHMKTIENAQNHPLLLMDWNAEKKDIIGAYSGKAVLIANGDSLNEVPREFLDENKTIGTNNIYLYGMTDEQVALYPTIKPLFLPSFYCILGIDQLDDERKRSYCRPAIEGAEAAFVNRMAMPYFDLPHVYAIHGTSWRTGYNPSARRNIFTKDLNENIGVGYTNTYIMLQVLYHLGFDEVYCVGLDNDYSVNPNRLHFYPDDPRFACEPLHGRKTHQKGSYYVFGLAKEAYEKAGKRIININKENNTPFEQEMPEW